MIAFFVCIVHASGQTNHPELIRLNQIGFYPNAQKLAVVADVNATEFFVTSADQSKKFYSGKLSEPKQSTYSPKKTKVADFSAFNTQGKYVLVVPGVGTSYEFEIRNGVHDAIAKASLKAFYFQRFSIPLTEKYAGRWKRAAGPDHRKVLIHASAATPTRKEGDIISCPRGWIDAGDYNKYAVNSGISTATLLSAYEDFPQYYTMLKTNIPESGNNVPDILDEALWNIRWMLTMQDPDDGGIYHKCTNAEFGKMVLPEKDTAARYVIMKTTAAALNFAAVTAQASRIFRHRNEFLGLADSCAHAADRAWQWAKQNPGVLYQQEKMNQRFDPDIKTGAYGDNDVSDEFIWAACELYITTGKKEYLNGISLFPDETMPVPTWNKTKLLGYYSLLRNRGAVASTLGLTLDSIRTALVREADRLASGVANHPYHTVMGSSVKDFVWGSNAVAANQAILLIYAFRMTAKTEFLTAALDNLDYILGRNATGYSFLTGYGDKTPMHIHHRPSEGDDVVDPVPGLLAGGPNPGMQDKCTTYPSSIPDEAYVDDVCSYASNEIAINWNAPLVYVAGAMETLESILGMKR